MDKSKGEPVISVKTKSKERVSNLYVLQSWELHVVWLHSVAAFQVTDLNFLMETHLTVQSSKSRDRKSSSKETKDILSFDQIKKQREQERQRQREREIREVERRRYT